MIKKILNYLRLKLKLNSLMVEVNETMDLTTSAETYARYVCKMKGWIVDKVEGYSMEFCAIDFAFMNGYIKALHDNGLEFQNGLVKKRAIIHEMPCGAVDKYIADEIAETKAKAVDTLRLVLESFKEPKSNIDIIATEFEKKLRTNEN